MEIFSIKDLLQIIQVAAQTFSELKGVIAEEALKLVLLPFHEFSFASCIIAFGWIYIFWKNKGLIFSAISHMFHLSEWFIRLFRRAQ